MKTWLQRILYSNVKTILFFSIIFSQIQTFAREENAYWQIKTEHELLISKTRYALPEKYKGLTCNVNVIRQQLANAPMEFTQAAASSQTIFHIPMPNGESWSFKMTETQIMHPDLAALFPTIKTYSGQGIEHPDALLKVSISSIGFHAMIMSPNGNVFIDPWESGNTTDYILYYRNDFKPYRSFNCELDEKKSDNGRIHQTIASGQASKSHGTQLRNYRLALSCTGEYAAYYGGTVSGAMAGMVASMLRVNGIYESEVAVRMTLVANNNLLIYTDAATDPFTNSNGSTMLGQNITTCNTVIGTANYDIGHVFSTGGGGVAYLGVPCTTNKAGGVTGSGSPVGDAFDVDYVAHEMGHQFGGSHTFNAGTGSCSGNRSSTAAFEPGSGITIMAYAGICGTNDLAPNSIAYFHVYSFNQITNYITTGSGNSCPTTTATGNTPPVVTPDAFAYTIPYLTPFALNATGSDANGDALTYSWEEYDLGAAGNWNAPVGDAPIFRPFSPVSSGTRTFPKISDIVNNTTTIGEILPSYARTLKFKVTARDNRANGGGVTFNDSNVLVNVINTGAAFAVTAPNTAVTMTGGSTTTVTWNVSSTNITPISCANVNILLSTDGGFTYPISILSGTPNDGSEIVTVPNNVTTTARIKVEGSGNIFFDISNVNFTIVAGGSVLSSISTNPISPLNLCAGQALSVAFTGNGNANSGNVYTAQLSTASGSFTGATSIGTLSSTAASGTIACVIPGGTVQGTGYRIRVISSLPSVIGANNGTNLTIQNTLGATGTISGASTVCQNQNGVVYSIPTVANASTYTWVLPSGFTITGGANTNSITVSIAANATGGSISVTPSNSCFNGTISGAYAVAVNLIPGAAGVISGNVSVCQGNSGVTYSVTSIANASSYVWTLPIGASISGPSNGNSILVNYSNSAVSGNILVSGQNACGLGASSSLAISVTTTPLPTVISNTGSTTVCSPGSVPLSFSSQAGISYQWRKNGVDLVGAVNSNYNASTSGNYDVVAKYTSVGSQQFNSTASVVIPDNSCTGASSPILVSGYTNNVSSSSIFVQMNLTHTYVGDLDIFLESPSGERIGISNRTGNSGNGGDNFTSTVFADSGAAILPTTGAPYTGLYKPWNLLFTVASCALTTTHTSFASLGGGSLNPNGTWNLRVYDRAGVDTGRVVNWSITFPSSQNSCASVSNAIGVTILPVPSLILFSPGSGVPGTTVNLYGSNFSAVSSVLFNGTPATIVNATATQITVTVPVGASSGLITINLACGPLVSSSSFTVNSANVNLTITALIEGFYIGGGNMAGVISPTMSDAITVELHQSTSPFGIVYAINTVLNLSGQTSLNIPAIYNGNSYYIVLRHRNSIETWSKVPVLMSSVVSYVFKQ